MTGIRSRVIVSSLALAALLIAPIAADTHPTPAGVFDQLKAMEGSWKATARQVEGEPEEGQPEEMTARHEFKVSGAGSVVMEVMGAGSDHEMINMYHMDGDDLVLTHYCAGGNQPTMKLDREQLADGAVEFDFSGGTNVDPAVDQHIHSAVIDWQEDGSVRSDWTAWADGEQVAVMEFVLTREE